MSENETLQNRNWNVLIYMAGVVILFFILLMRLFSLQYTHYDENLQRSENNRIRNDGDKHAPQKSGTRFVVSQVAGH